MKLIHTDVDVQMYRRPDVLWRFSVKFVAVVQRWGTDSSEEEEGMNPIFFFPESLHTVAAALVNVCVCVFLHVYTSVRLYCREGRRFVNEFLQLCLHHRVSCRCRCKADWTSLFEPGSSSFCLICLQQIQVCMFFVFFHFIQQSVTLHTSCQLICEKGTTVLGTRLH